MRRKKDFFIILILSILLISLVYGAGSCKAGNTVIKLSGDWTITMIDDVELDPEDLSKGLPFIRLDPLEGMISGNTGCNDFTGEAVYTNDAIDIGELIRTEIACQNMEVEEKLFEILDNKIVNFDINGETLIMDNVLGKITLIMNN